MKRWIITSIEQPNIEKIDHREEVELFRQIQSEIVKEVDRWNKDYTENKYRNVFSITDNEAICNTLTRGIKSDIKKIFIPGCGSKTNLQKYIIDNFPHIESIFCADWSQSAIEQAKTGYNHEKIKYLCEDTSNLSFSDNMFDYVIVSNSILSNHDLLNRRMLQECCRVLRKGGQLYGFFPTIFCGLEIAYLDHRFAKFVTNGAINIVKNSIYEPTQKLRQIFYTPLRLKQIFQEAGFKRKKFEIYFFDDEYFERESERIYGLPQDSGLCVWEILAVVEKAEQSATFRRK